VLEKTFIHIPGLGETTERSLWEQGCLSWEQLAGNLDRYSCGSALRSTVERTLKGSAKALANGEHQFFRRKLGLKEAWRAFPDFRSSCVYLDIETDGGNSGSSVTVIGMYDGKDFTCLTKGEDLGNFPDFISHYSMIVTFCGATFDLPTLQRCFGSLKFDQIHIDLYPTLKRLGHHGGLKKIEANLGIERSPETAGLNGYDAVKLWRRHIQLGDTRALDRLIAYNREDVVNLERLAEYAYENLWRRTFSVDQGVLTGLN
jgi:uncharacterized protein YprB with RNaseH-like and TPR domain